jgi:hypothetical protein
VAGFGRLPACSRWVGSFSRRLLLAFAFVAWFWVASPACALWRGWFRAVSCLYLFRDWVLPLACLLLCGLVHVKKKENRKLKKKGEERMTERRFSE